MKIKLHGFGEIDCLLPSLAICFDIVSTWSGVGQNKSIMGRLCAAAIVTAIQGKKQSIPRYTLSNTDPVAFGGECLDYLLSSGVSIDQIFENGLQIVTWYASMLPTSNEVAEAENFTE